MKKIPNIFEKTPIKRNLEKLKEDEKKDFIEKIYNNEWTYSLLYTRLSLFVDICLNPSNLKSSKVDLYYLYFSSKKYDKAIIRHGLDHKEKIEKTLKNRKKTYGRISKFSFKYWMNKGFTEEESKKIISENSRKASLKSADIKKQRLRNNDKTMCSYYKEYWIHRGYSEEVAEENVKKEKWRTSPSLKRDIERYGTLIGIEKFNKKHKKRRETMMAKYGCLAIYTKKASKESMKFFIPLYKKLRKRGIERKDIFWGIGKNREYAMRDSKNNTNYFYDFTIHSKKIILEYNNPFWHARKESEFCHFIDFEEAKKREERKINIMENLGYKVIIIWSDDNFKEKYEEILGVVFNGN